MYFKSTPGIKSHQAGFYLGFWVISSSLLSLILDIALLNSEWAQHESLAQFSSLMIWLWIALPISEWVWREHPGWLSLLVSSAIVDNTNWNKWAYFCLLTCKSGGSGVARSLVLARHLLYTSPLAWRVLCARLCDMSRTSMVLWPGTCPARPSLHYATAWWEHWIYNHVLDCYTSKTSLLSEDAWVHHMNIQSKSVTQDHSLTFLYDCIINIPY